MRLLKLVEQMRHEIESSSLHYDMDEIVDLFDALESAVIEFAESHDDDD